MALILGPAQSLLVKSWSKPAPSSEQAQSSFRADELAPMQLSALAPWLSAM
jgi:hypothetical protein